MEPLLLKAGEVAKLLGLGRSKVFAMLAVGELPVIRIGRSVRVPRVALEGWIAEHTRHASGRSEGAGPLLAEVEDRDGVPGASPSPHSEVFPESRSWAFDGRRARRRLGRRPERRRPAEAEAKREVFSQVLCIFLISNRPAAIRTRQGTVCERGAGPRSTLTSRTCDCTRPDTWLPADGGPPIPASGHVRP